MIPVSLTGLRWEFRGCHQEPWREAAVPGCVHRDLLRHGLLPDPFWARNEHEVQWVSERVWEYRTHVEVDDLLLAQEEVELAADGLDTLATVFVNGTAVGRAENMFTAHRFPVKKVLKAGSNELLVRFDSATRFIREQRRDHAPRDINDPVGGCTRIRKEQCQFGWDWAPRLVTAGIWRDLRLEGWSETRLVDARILQKHRRGGVVLLQLTPELSRPNHRVRYEASIRRNGQVIARFESLEARVHQPELWWPNGQGGQPLYEVCLEASLDGRSVGTWKRRIGLRTVELRRKRDKWGESFAFVVNGRPVFAKGASWIPAHCFVAGLKRDDYARDLRSAAEANMNMVRVWGGGVYESEDFYDLCDELGLLVWHDFMFACTLYPGDRAFQELVAREAEHQIRRLRHRACLALWCGNNELELLNADALKVRTARKAYDALFRRILPEAVERLDGATPYWRSSPSQSSEPGLRDAERSGNAHFWDVWHARYPVERYEEKFYRFISEFGMQSFPSAELARTFCPPEQLNVFAPAMENHQKNPVGNQVLLDYISRRYRLPKDYASLAYASQLNQAHCMQVGVEHYRRCRPRTMGALYWQLNDCWPVASWSSLEFDGQWKPLHFAARRFFAPLLLSAQLLGTEKTGIGNRVQSTIRGVILHTVSDLPEDTHAAIRWRLCRLDGQVLRQGARDVRLRANTAQAWDELDFTPELHSHGHAEVFLRYSLWQGDRRLSEETTLFTAPRLIEFTPAAIQATFTPASAVQGTLTFRSDVFHHRVWFSFGGLPFRAEDNAFDLYPGEACSVAFRLLCEPPPEGLEARLRVRSLVDTYR